MYLACQFLKMASAPLLLCLLPSHLHSTTTPIPTRNPIASNMMSLTSNSLVGRKIFSVSSAKDDNPSVELVVTALNVNNGHNVGLMKACKALKGYSIFVSKVRKYKQLVEDEYDLSHSTPLKLLADKRDVMNNLIKKAVILAIDECIQENVLKSFFEEYREEIIIVGVLEYSYERHMQVLQDESYNNGVKDTTELFSWLKANGRASDVLTAIDDADFLSQLFTEYEVWKRSNNTSGTNS